MVSLWLLPVSALFAAVCAASIAELRRLSKERVTRETAAAVVAGAASVVAGICLYAIGAQFTDETACRNAGAACFLVFPIISVIILNVEARRLGFRPGSSILAFLSGLVAVVFIGVWATYSWKGPRGDWRATDLLVFASSVALIYGAAACLGWWCGRSMRQTNA